MLRKIGSLRDGAPKRELGDEDFRLRVSQKFEMLAGGKFVIEGNQNATGEKNGVGGNQPFRLIRHDDGGAAGGGKTGILQRGGKRQGRVAKLAKRQALRLAVAVGFDEASFFGPALKRGTKGVPEGVIFCEVEHLKLGIFLRPGNARTIPPRKVSAHRSSYLMFLCPPNSRAATAPNSYAPADFSVARRAVIVISAFNRREIGQPALALAAAV